MSTLAQPVEKPTLADALRALLVDFTALVGQRVRSAATLCMHREHVGWWLTHLNVRLPLDAVDADVISSLADAERAGRNGRQIGNGTLLKRLATLRLALESARRRRWIARVPAFPAIEHRRRAVNDGLQSIAELEVLASTLPIARAEWIYVAAFTGMHPSDLNRMRAFVDVDPFALPPWFMARNTKNRDPVGVKAELAAPAADVLRRRFEREGTRPGDPALSYWDKNARGKALRRRRDWLGLRSLRATSMRHTFISWAVDELGTITRAVQEVVGHKSLEMMQKVYARALRPRFAEVAAAVARKATRPLRLPAKGSSRRWSPKRKEAIRLQPDGLGNRPRRRDATGPDDR